MAALNLKTMQELQKNCIECAALQMGLKNIKSCTGHLKFSAFMGMMRVKGLFKLFLSILMLLKQNK